MTDQRARGRLDAATTTSTGHDRLGPVEPGSLEARGYGCICMPGRIVNAQILPFELAAGCPVHPDHRWVRLTPRSRRQLLIAAWAKASFGEAEATSIPQRGVRLLEEAVELYQACGGDEAMAHKLVTYVFGRDKGTVGQELGGVAVCALLVAEAAGLSADEEEAREIFRILGKPTKHFTERNANKNAAGFLAAGRPDPAPKRVTLTAPVTDADGITHQSMVRSRDGLPVECYCSCGYTAPPNIGIDPDEAIAIHISTCGAQDARDRLDVAPDSSATEPEH